MLKTTNIVLAFNRRGKENSIPKLSEANPIDAFQQEQRQCTLSFFNSLKLTSADRPFTKQFTLICNI